LKTEVNLKSKVTLKYSLKLDLSLNSSAKTERPRCRVGQLWQKVKDNILQTIWVPLWC